jgi:hypothetical protein
VTDDAKIQPKHTHTSMAQTNAAQNQAGCIIHVALELFQHHEQLQYQLSTSRRYVLVISQSLTIGANDQDKMANHTIT